MIVKIDHIAFATDDIDRDIALLSDHGYSVRFVEKGLHDLDNKRTYMERFDGQLDMALLCHPHNVDIEVLDHGHVAEAPSYVLPILEPGEFQDLGDTIATEGTRFTRVYDANLRAELFICGNASAGSIGSTLVAETDNLKTSAAFWERFGFRRTNNGDDVIRLEYPALLSGGICQMLLRRTDRCKSRFLLDGRGFNCIAFFSSNVRKDHFGFEEKGLGPTAINPLRIDGKDLDIFWVRGPYGELVEVIGLAKQRNT